MIHTVTAAAPHGPDGHGPGPVLRPVHGEHGHRPAPAGSWESIRRPGGVLVAVATGLLFLLGVGLFAVSLDAQYRYVFHAKHQSAASWVEALALDVGMAIFSLLALGLARAGQPARVERARHTAATVLLVLRQPTPTVMSLMGWSSESMAARYQHVTDVMRSQVASQVGDLIWKPPADPGDRAVVTVPSNSLAAILAVAEKCVASHRGPAGQSAEVLAALGELRAALPDAAARSETANETKTETRRPTEG